MVNLVGKIEKEEILNAREVGKLLKISLPLVYKMADRGQLPCVRWECPTSESKRPKTMLRFKQSDVWAFIENNYRAT